MLKTDPRDMGFIELANLISALEEIRTLHKRGETLARLRALQIVPPAGWAASSQDLLVYAWKEMQRRADTNPPKTIETILARLREALPYELTKNW